MRAVLVGLLLVAVGCGDALAGGTAGTHATAPVANVLMKSYAPVVGDMVALTAAHVLSQVKVIDAPVVVSFNHETRKIEVGVLGVWASVDNAKKTLEGFMEKGMPVIAEVASGQYGVTIDEKLVTVIYMNRTDGLKEILRREDGQFVVK